MKVNKYNDSYESYITQCNRLASTLKIISFDAIESINKQMASRGFEVSQDKSSWKYFLNACGEYHESDRPMMVFSADTQEQIEFSAANLRIHTSTRKIFMYGTTGYYSLLHQHKDQESLILGSLYPANMREAIEAFDGKIISYQEDLVEDQEKTLLPHIQTWLKNFIFRWHIKRYNISSPLYSLSRHATMYSRLPHIISAYRFKKIKTVETHSFHVKEHLKSNYRVDMYYDYLTKKQKWWLYRNIEYIVRRAGHQDTMYLLIKNILTERGIPISQYHLRQISDKEGLNIEAHTKRSTAVWRPTSGKIVDLDRIMPVIENSIPFSEYKPDPDKIKKKANLSTSGKVFTKFLESIFIDRNSDLKVIRTELIISQWLFYASVGLFEGSVVLTDGKAIGKSVMSVEDALSVIINSGFTRLSLEVKRTGIMPIRGFFSGRDFVTTKIDSLGVKLNRSTTLLIGSLPTIDLFRSGKKFIEAMDSMYRKVYCFLIKLERSDESVFNQGVVINAMFPSMGININITEEQYSKDYGRYVMSVATGLPEAALISKQEVQLKLLALIDHLSSYTVRYLDPVEKYFSDASYFNGSSLNTLSKVESNIRLYGLILSKLYMSAKITSSGSSNYENISDTLTIANIISKAFIDVGVVEIVELKSEEVSLIEITNNSIGIIEYTSNYEGEENPYIPNVFEFVRINTDLGIKSFKKIE